MACTTTSMIMRMAIATRRRIRRISWIRCEGDSPPDGLAAIRETGRVRLRRTNVLGAGTLWALTDRERDGIALAQRVEWGAGARGVVEEVFGAFGRRDEAEAL